MNSSLLVHLLAQGATSSSMNSALKEAIVAAGTASGVLTDYLADQGFTSGTVVDRLFAYLGDKGYTGSLSDRWTAAAAAGAFIGSCVYPLNAESSELGVIGFLPLTMSSADQKGSQTLTGAPGAQVRALAVPDGAITGTPAYMDFTTGIKVLEILPVIPSSVGGGTATEAYSLRVYLMASLNDIRMSIVMSQLADGTSTVDIDIGGVNVYTSTVVPAAIGVIIDSSGTADVQFDGVSVALSDDTFVPDQLFVAMAVYEQTASQAGDAGTVVSAQMVTGASSISSVLYPPGARDVCGVLLSNNSNLVVATDGESITATDGQTVHAL